MKQMALFDNDERKDEPESIYAKTTAKNLIYETSERRPHLAEIIDRVKTRELERKIQQSNVSEDEKCFLMLAAQRHNGFVYDLIADYYSHASAEMQNLMEESGLVIVDFDKAIELGFVQLSEKICNQYSEEQK